MAPARHAAELQLIVCLAMAHFYFKLEFVRLLVQLDIIKLGHYVRNVQQDAPLAM